MAFAIKKGIVIDLKKVSEELAQKSQAGKIDKDTWYAVLKKLPPEKIEDLAKKWGISLE